MYETVMALALGAAVLALAAVWLGLLLGGPR